MAAVFKRIGVAALAVAATAVLAPSVVADNSDNPKGQSTFISPDENVAFALTIPDNGTDVLFSIRAPEKRSWAAIGLGSDDMAGALVLMIYKSSNGNDVTFSPRLATGHTEPSFYDDLRYHTIENTVEDGYMKFTARCTKHCRNWPAAGKMSKGWIDTTSASSHAIFAYGPDEELHSDDQDYSVKLHAGHGSFAIDMSRANGVDDAPVLTDKSENDGAELVASKRDNLDWKSAAHGALMVSALVFLMPLGASMMHLNILAKFHSLVQSVALCVALAGFAIGVYGSLTYQRSLDFLTYHQSLGMLIVVFLLLQLSLGWLHHTRSRKNGDTKRLAMYHRWVGRVVLFIAALNAIFGFHLARNGTWGWVVVGIVATIAFGAVFMSTRRRKNERLRRQMRPLGSEAPPAYPLAPWTDSNPQSAPQRPVAGDIVDPPPGYEPQSNQAGSGLRPVSPWQRRDADKDPDEDANVQTAQQPREFT